MVNPTTAYGLMGYGCAARGQHPKLNGRWPPPEERLRDRDASNGHNKYLADARRRPSYFDCEGCYCIVISNIWPRFILVLPPTMPVSFFKTMRRNISKTPCNSMIKLQFLIISKVHEAQLDEAIRNLDKFLMGNVHGGIDPAKCGLRSTYAISC